MSDSTVNVVTKGRIDLGSNIVTPENTKLIAEWMGLDAIHIFKSDVRIKLYPDSLHYSVSYNLIIDAEQSREIEKKLLGLEWEIRFEKLYECTKYTSSEGVVKLKAETLELTIYAASLHEAKK